MTKNTYTAFASGDEPEYGIQSENWARMGAAGAVNWGEPSSIDFGVDPVNACGPLYTNVKYADTSTCGGKEHCSTAIDDTIPYLEQTAGEKFYLYEAEVWPALVTQYSSTGCKSTKSAKGAKAAKGTKAAGSITGKADKAGRGRS